MTEKKYIEVDELDFRPGLTELLSTHGKINHETNQLINTIIIETKTRAIHDSLKMYIEEGFKMSHKELIEEEHKSTRLSKFLQCQGYVKPSDQFEMHALVSGGHPRAVIAREILAQFDIRIDDPSNGVWLPNFKKHLPDYPSYNSSHRSIHRKIYYLNLTACLEQTMSRVHARCVLRRVAQGIITDDFPIHRRMRVKEIMEFSKGLN